MAHRDRSAERGAQALRCADRTGVQPHLGEFVAACIVPTVSGVPLRRVAPVTRELSAALRGGGYAC